MIKAECKACGGPPLRPPPTFPIHPCRTPTHWVAQHLASLALGEVACAAGFWLAWRPHAVRGRTQPLGAASLAGGARHRPSKPFPARRKVVVGYRKYSAVPALRFRGGVV